MINKIYLQFVLQILIQNVHKDYEKLMSEHLSLEKYCATLVQAQPSVRQLEQQVRVQFLITSLTNRQTIAI